MAAQAAPNRNENTTICSTSPRAMASMTLAGKVCSRIEPTVGVACGRAGFGGGRLERHALARRIRFTAPRPRNSAMVVSTSK